MPARAPAFRIRRASGEQDADLIAPLFDSYRQFYDKPADPELARAFIRDRLKAGESVIFVAEGPAQGASGEALGFVQLYPSFSSVAARPIWVLNDLFVASTARRLGVGRALMEAARQHAVQTGAKRLTLETVAENRNAWTLYESLGYVCHEPSTRFYTLELSD
jgi:ribosomal protein S18 acetylase RimI-like enzyme